MATPEIIQPSLIAWVKPFGDYLFIPAVLILFKFLFDLFKLVISQHSGVAEKSHDHAEIERRLQHSEDGLRAVGADCDKLEARVDTLYLIKSKDRDQ